MMCIELRAQNLRNVHSLLWVYVMLNMLTLMLIEHTSTMLPVNVTQVMINNIKLEVTIKFGASEMMCVELRAQKLRNVYSLQ